MIQLQDLVDLFDIECGNYPAVFIVNKPYSKEHILFLSLDNDQRDLQRLLKAIGSAPVVYVDLDAVVRDSRGSYSGVKIIIDEPNGFFPMGDPDTYGDGFIDFGDIESGTYDRQQFFTYKDMGFRIPGQGLRVPN